MAIPKEKVPRLKLGNKFKKLQIAPDNLEWHKIVKGESLEIIAKDHGWRLEDLFHHNWRTVNPLEVNWYLRKYVGCLNHDGKSYIFNGLEKPGMILVPKRAGFLLKGPGREVKVPRNGKSTLDSHLQIRVVETLADAGYEEVSGKWLYVFSGAGVDFGYDPPPQPKQNREGVTADHQPGSAFDLGFPGVFHLKEKPDKVEYEIYVTSDKAPSPDLVKAVSGLTEIGKTKLMFGKNWYFLSDSTVLEKAKTESRHNRVEYIPRNFKTVSIDLAPNGQNRRFYFLLSPIKLGPKAIKFAMDNPNGLTPLLKDNVHTIINDPSHPPAAFDPKALKQNLGPVPADIKKNPVLLMVIDPYAWAENIANQILPRNLKEYKDWFDTKKDETTEALTAKTGWTLDHLTVASLLKSVRDSHPKDLDKELKDPDKFKLDLNLWEKEIDDRNAAILANMHRSILLLILWLEGPAHKIIETAILQDTNLDNPKDATDIAIGLMHWGICSEQMISLAPGIGHLNQVFNQSGTVVYDLLLKYIKDSDTNTPASNVKVALERSWQLSNSDVLLLYALRNFVSPQPPIVVKGTQKESFEQKIEYLKKKTSILVKFLNEHQIIPGEVQAIPLPSLEDSSTWGLSNVLPVIVSSLDIIDKGVNRKFIEKQKRIEELMNKFKDLKDGAFMDAANHEIYTQKYKRVFWKVKPVSWTFKGAALGISVYNLFNVFTKSRYDYQTNKMTGSTTEKLKEFSGFVLAVQDTFVEIGEIARYIKGDKTWMSRAFPSLIDMEKGGLLKYGPAQFKGFWDKVFAGANAATFAAFSVISGVTTMISMEESRQKAYNRGDYLAADYYTLGKVGGVMTIAGGVMVGVSVGASLVSAGVSASLTGIGATIGVFLILIGAIVALVASIVGSRKSSDDYQVFARKCFLGKEGNMNPRFGGEPEDWSHAPEIGEWTIHQQKRAILNLLGRFILKTSLHPDYDFDFRKGIFKGPIYFDITPGLMLPGTTVEIELYYRKINFEKSTQKTSAIVEWNGPRTHPTQKHYKPLKFTKGGLFDAENTTVKFGFDKDTMTWINILVKDVTFEHKQFAELLTDVTIRYPRSENVIRTRKLVLKLFDNSSSQSGIKTLAVDKDEETSRLFE